MISTKKSSSYDQDKNLSPWPNLKLSLKNVQKCNIAKVASICSVFVVLSNIFAAMGSTEKKTAMGLRLDNYFETTQQQEGTLDGGIKAWYLVVVTHSGRKISNNE